MSNTASGFKHISLNTSRPINTPIGSFETQIVAGVLKSSRVTIDNALFTVKPIIGVICRALLLPINQNGSLICFWVSIVVLLYIEMIWEILSAIIFRYSHQ